MGVATPKTGQIAFSDLNSGILQAGTTAQLNMNTAAQRMGFGSTSQVSISELRGCVGTTVSAPLQPASKFVPSAYYTTISLTYSPAGDVINQAGENPFNPAPAGGTDGSDYFTFFASGLSGPPTAGWQGTNINRACTTDTVRTINSADSQSVYLTPQVFSDSTTRSIGFRFG